jgi:hypothetical protein
MSIISNIPFTVLFFLFRLYIIVQHRWCDQELGKFASTFGGPRLLGRLSLASATDSATAASGESPTGSANTGTAFKQPMLPPDKNPKVSENNRQVRTKTAFTFLCHPLLTCFMHNTVLASSSFLPELASFGCCRKSC